MERYDSRVLYRRDMLVLNGAEAYVNHTVEPIPREKLTKGCNTVFFEEKRRDPRVIYQVYPGVLSA